MAQKHILLLLSHNTTLAMLKAELKRGKGLTVEFKFTPAPAYQEGSLFLGVNEYAAGIRTERHLITVAGARSGKGAGLIVPNLRKWSSGSVLVIDPKGENATLSWEAREAMGHTVRVIDPFKVADVPARLRAAFNPLQAVIEAEAALDRFVMQDANGRGHTLRDMGEVSTAREDIRVIADGLVMRHAAENPMWDNGAASVLAGLIAHNLTTAPDDLKTLPAMRALLRWPDEQLEDVFKDMAENPAFDGLAQTAAAVGLSSAKSAREFVKGARDQTDWLDSSPMRSVLEKSTFDLADLKNGRTAVFLVLPPQYIQEHGRFLRLFVRCAINAMAKGGQGGGKCLFLLDEFFSLGHIEEIAKAAGLMPSYGVHLWPFLQDLGQLVKLYGKEGAETFFGNADAHIFFGNTDPLTLEHISARIGRYSANEITTTRVDNPPPPMPSMPLQDPALRVTQYLQQLEDYDDRTARAREAFLLNQLHDAEARKVGQPRIPPDRVRETIAKKDGDAVARSMIVFGKGGDIFHLLVWPYFWDEPRTLADIERERKAAEREAMGQKMIEEFRQGIARDTAPPPPAPPPYEVDPVKVFVAVLVVAAVVAVIANFAG